jgi:hypothetical protein
VLGRSVTVGRLRKWVRGRRALVVGALIAVVACSTAALATGPGGWDHLGDAWSAGTDSLNGVADAFNAAAPDRLYVGGGFTDAGGIAEADRIAIWTGSAWSAVSSGASQIDNGVVHAIAVANGRVYAGGTFQNAGGDADADFLAVWDGASWSPPCDAAGPAFGGNVDALQIIGSTLYVGGAFQNAVNNAAADYLVACDLSSRAPSVTTVNPLHPFPGPVYALAADPDGVLYAGGRWNDLEQNPAADNVAYRDGTGWHEMGAGGGACGCVIDGFVRSLAADADGVYVGTDVKNVDGIPQADNVVKWDGSAWSALGADAAGDNGWFPASTFIYGMTVSSSVVFATGSFQDGDGNPLADNVAAFSAGAWRHLGSDGAGNGPWIGNGLALARNGDYLFAAGNFTSAGGDTQAHSVASFAMSQIPVATPTQPAAPTAPATPSTPTTTITSGPADGSTISDNTPTFEYISSDPDAFFECAVRRVVDVVDVSPVGLCPSPHTLAVYPDGKYEFRVASRTAVSYESNVERRTYTVDTTVPRPRLSGALTQTAGSDIGVLVSCGAEACTATASGAVSVPGAARVYTLRSVKRAVAAKHKVSLKVRVPAKAQAAIRNALRHHRKVVATIRVRVADKAGNARVGHRRVKLRR